MATYVWIDVAGGDYEIGLREDEARAFADEAARRNRAAAAADPDELHPDREAKQLAEMWGNPDYLYGQLAHSMPAHHVTLAACAITKSPVTLAHWTRFRLETNAAPRATHSGNAAREVMPDTPSPDQPITGLTWQEAETFATWAGAALVPDAVWEAALRTSRSPFGDIGHELYEWCADEFAPYPGADRVAVGRITPPLGGWWGTRVRRVGSFASFPVNVVGRRGADPTVALRDTTFRLVRR